MHPENHSDLRDEDENGPRKKALKASGLSLVRSFIRFLNVSGRSVDVVWLNYEGSRVKYKTLHPRQYVDVNTFVGHPWLFRDSDTGDRLVVQSKEIYDPAPVDWVSPRRKIVFITIPVYSLKVRCLHVLRKMTTVDKVDELILPRELKEELKHSIRPVSNCNNQSNSVLHVSNQSNAVDNSDQLDSVENVNSQSNASGNVGDHSNSPAHNNNQL